MEVPSSLGSVLDEHWFTLTRLNNFASTTVNPERKSGAFDSSPFLPPIEDEEDDYLMPLRKTEDLGTPIKEEPVESFASIFIKQEACHNLTVSGIKRMRLPCDLQKSILVNQLTRIFLDVSHPKVKKLLTDCILLRQKQLWDKYSKDVLNIQKKVVLLDAQNVGDLIHRAAQAIFTLSTINLNRLKQNTGLSNVCFEEQQKIAEEVFLVKIE